MLAIMRPSLQNQKSSCRHDELRFDSRIRLKTMTSIVDSEAHLSQRAGDVGLTAGSLAAIRRHGFTTLGKLAFSHGQPGTQIDSDAFHRYAENLLGAMMTLGDEAALKRLLFEGHTLVLSQLRESITNPEASHSRKLPQVERTAKMEALKAQLVGVCIERQLDPSHALLDSASQQYESQQLVYLSPDKCSSWEWEVQMAKTDQSRRRKAHHKGGSTAARSDSIFRDASFRSLASSRSGFSFR